MKLIHNIYKVQFFLIAFVCFSIKAQELPVIAITEIKSSVDSRYWQDYKNSKALNFQTMLETQLVQTKRFKIMERNRIDEVLSEQVLQGEFSQNNTQTKVGGVDYIVYGSVTKFGSKRKNINTGSVSVVKLISEFGVDLKVVDYIVYGSVTKFGSKRKNINTGSVSVVKLISEFGVDLKVVDVLTGEIIKAETVDISLETGSGTSTNSFGISDTLADPLSDIQRTAAKSASALIAESIFPIKLITWDEEKESCCAYLNYGDAIISTGDIFRVIEQGKSFVDPDTGLKLGSTEKTVSKLRVIEVLENFSKAEIIEGKTPSGGELVRLDLNSSLQKQSVQRERLGKKL